MILLTSTSDLVQVIKGTGVTSITCHASYVDYNGSISTPGRTNNVWTGATTDTAVGSPAGSTQRNVKSLVISNTSATASAITVQHTDGANVTILLKYTLQAGETIQYYDTLGFQVIDATGSLKLSPGTGRFNKRTVLTSGNTTFAMDSATKSYIVELVGAGGGGGGAGGNAGNNSASGGGGAGAYTSKRYAASTSATYTYGIGVGGVAGTGNANGSTGGVTTWTDGTTAINGAAGLGGVGGGNVTANPLRVGGAGGAANANGDINGAGAPGGPATWSSILLSITGFGGSTLWGQGGVESIAPGNGANGTGFGAGGAGGYSNSAGNNGGNGAGGVAIVTEYT